MFPVRGGRTILPLWFLGCLNLIFSWWSLFPSVHSSQHPVQHPCWYDTTWCCVWKCNYRKMMWGAG